MAIGHMIGKIGGNTMLFHDQNNGFLVRYWDHGLNIELLGKKKIHWGSEIQTNLDF